MAIYYCVAQLTGASERGYFYPFVISLAGASMFIDTSSVQHYFQMRISDDIIGIGRILWHLPTTIIMQIDFMIFSSNSWITVLI